MMYQVNVTVKGQSLNPNVRLRGMTVKGLYASSKKITKQEIEAHVRKEICGSLEKNNPDAILAFTIKIIPLPGGFFLKNTDKNPNPAAKAAK